MPTSHTTRQNKRKEYAQEITYIPKRSRRGHVKHLPINVTPSSSQFTSSPGAFQQDNNIPVISALSIPTPTPLSPAHHSAPPDIPDEPTPRPSRKGKVSCLQLFFFDLLSILFPL